MTAILSQNETQSTMSMTHRVSLWFLNKLLSKAKNGKLEIVLPNGKQLFFGELTSAKTVELNINEWAFFTKILVSGDVGFGESFVDDDWSSPDLTALLHWFAINQTTMEDQNFAFSKMGDLVNWFGHKLKANTIDGSRQNISDHYDLSNDLYEAFLDPHMQYSCALWKTPSESLEEAQENKMRAVLDKLQLKPGMRVLEVGSGWGGLAVMAVKEYGVHVKSITLSEQQLKVAEQRAKDEGVQDLIQFKYQDYRHELGKFDRVMSVEMVEAVGHENLSVYFKKIEEVLKPSGLAVVQVITTPNSKYHTYRKNCDWIQKYIFPGAVCPSLESMVSAMTSNTKLMIHDLENFGTHYARTLREWNHRFHNNWKEIQKSGFDERFRKIWEYYLCYCEAGYEARSLDNLQLVISKENNESLNDFGRGR